MDGKDRSREQIHLKVKLEPSTVRFRRHKCKYHELFPNRNTPKSSDDSSEPATRLIVPQRMTTPVVRGITFDHPLNMACTPQVLCDYDEYGNMCLAIPEKPWSFYAAFFRQSVVGTDLQNVSIGQAMATVKRISRYESQEPSIVDGCETVEKLAREELERLTKDRNGLIDNIIAFVHRGPRLVPLCMLHLGMLVGRRLANRQDEHELSDVFHHDEQVYVEVKLGDLYSRAVFYNGKDHRFNENGLCFFESDLVDFHDGYLSLLRLHSDQHPSLKPFQGYPITRNYTNSKLAISMILVPNDRDQPRLPQETDHTSVEFIVEPGLVSVDAAPRHDRITPDEVMDNDTTEIGELVSSTACIGAPTAGTIFRLRRLGVKHSQLFRISALEKENALLKEQYQWCERLMKGIVQRDLAWLDDRHLHTKLTKGAGLAPKP